MEGGGSAEPRTEKEEEKAGAAERRGAGAGAAMKFRVSARAPHGVEALLLIGGAALVGAAVVAWRHARRGKGGAKNQRDRQPVKEEVLDGGVVEDEKGGAAAWKLDRPDENLSGENTKIGSYGLDGEATAEIRHIHKDEIVAEELDTKPAEKFDQSSSRKPVEIKTHDMDIKPAEKFDQNSRSNPVEITMHEESKSVEKVDENSSKKDIKNKITRNENEDVVTSDQSNLSITGPGIALHKHSNNSDDAQEAESMENTPTAQLMIHQEQPLNDMMTDTVTETEEAKLGEGTDSVTETEEAKLGEGTIIDKDVYKQEEQKAIAELIGLVGSPALSSLVKPREKKEPALQGRNETGMKIEQDCTNGVLKEHDLSKAGATPGGAIVTMDRRSVSMAIVALIFAVTIGITIIMHLYAPPRATKLQMDSQ
ncbi:uncharacterized protein LOC133906616 [Phragmites australis]|uniref:uncharacterized protein LOC133906616 n=1 Tax=Phragmites australis TaxID=29695 RepID=UPI002D77DA3F|nr:uncharacterized protein LOC133906616 [Phragmites australis]